MFNNSTFRNFAAKRLIAIGLVELGLAGLFAVLALMIPSAAAPLLGTAGMLGVTGGILAVVGMRAGKAAERADGA
jgi:hypothetical protein